MNKKTVIAATAVVFVGLFFVASTLYNNNKTEEANSATKDKVEHIQRDYSPVMGPADAKVTIVEFFDPACGTCAAFYPFVKQLMSENPGQVNLALRYLPLHQNSDVVVSIFEAARLQNRFADVLDLAYKTRNKWIEHHVARPDKLWVLIGELGLDMEKLKADAQSDEVARRVKQDMLDAQKLGVNKTPGFFVNGKPLVTFGYQQLQDLVEAEVAVQY